LVDLTADLMAVHLVALSVVQMASSKADSWVVRWVAYSADLWVDLKVDYLADHSEPYSVD